MKNLILIRHAKSGWDNPSDDFDRRLAERGISDANLVSNHIRKFLPDNFVIYASPARRAAETARIFSHNIPYPLENIIFLQELYTFDGDKLEKIVRAFDDNYDNIILFGHNEAITNFVNKFGDIYIDNVSTSGFVELALDTNSWKTISKGKTRNVILPRDLKQ